jgi:hypothetical protein
VHRRLGDAAVVVQHAELVVHNVSLKRSLSTRVGVVRAVGHHNSR